MLKYSDSRLYLSRAGQVYQLSEDHTYVNDAIRHGLMTPEQAASSPYAHAVTRGIGMGEMVCVDTMVFDVTPNDSFLLCSDGLYDYFENNREIAEFLGADDTEQVPGRLVPATECLFEIAGSLFEFYQLAGRKKLVAHR